MKRLTRIFHALLGVVALICTPIIALGRLVLRTINNWFKRMPRWARRMVAITFIFLLTGVLALKIYGLFYDRHYSYYCYQELSDRISVHSFGDDTCRLYDNVNEEYTTGKFRWISGCSEESSLAVYALPYKRGYIDVETGKVVIDAETSGYSRAWVFSEGVAAVEKDGKVGFINEKNEVVIPFKFDYSDRHDMWNLGFLFHDGYCVMTNAEGKLGLIDRDGNWVKEPEYDQLWIPQRGNYRIVVKDDKYGVLDSSLNLAYEVAYDYIDISSDVDCFVLSKDGRMWQEDFTGRVVRPFMFESLYILSYPISEDDDWGEDMVMSDYAKYRISGKYGILNRTTGKPLTLAIYDEVEMISETVFQVSLEGVYGYNLLDSNGRPIR